MKKRLLYIFLTAALMLLIVPIVGAQPSSYNTGFQVANQSSTTANIVVTYYNQDGSVNASVSDTVPGNGSVTYFPIDATAGFNGSVVISSDQQVAAIANVLGDGTAFGASYESFASGAPSVNLPLIMKGNFGFNTWFNVQNTGTSTDANVTVSYAGQPTCNQTATVKPGAAATFNQATHTCLPAGYVGAATVTATGADIVATVMQTGPAQLLAYNGFTSGASQPAMPLVQAKNFGYDTGIQIQNTGNQSTQVTVTYTPATAGTSCTETKTIAQATSATFALAATCLQSQFVGAASVTTNSTSQPLVAIVNQTNFTDKGSAYNGVDPGSATATVNFPLIMQANFGFFTGFNVYNVGGPVTVTCTFSGAGAPATVTQSLGTGSALNAVQLGTTQYVGSATCNAPGGSIVGIANELGSGAGDNFFAYGGFNR